MRIIRDYEMYMLRSLQRGYGAKDLGVSDFKVQRIKIKDSVKKLILKYENSRFGRAFDQSYEKVKKNVGKLLKNLTGG